MTNEEAKMFLDNLKICIDEHPIVADWLVEIADRKTEPQEKEVEWVYNKRERLWYPYSNGELLFETENSSEKPNNCEHITEDGVTCARYPACDDCHSNPLNKVKGSERLVKGTEQTEPQRGCDADCNEDCTECAKEWQDWKDQMWTEAVIASKDEPQTDCAWQNDEHIPTELASTMLKNRFKEQNDG